MKWNELTIGKKIALGYAIILLLLLFLGALNYLGVGTIVRNATEVISGNRLSGLLTVKELDHLNWAGRVNALLTDETVTELSVETDPHKCGLGKWLYSEERKAAEQLVPSLAPLLKKIEEPHRKLHESAIEIKNTFKQADVTAPVKICMIEAAHQVWAAKIRDAIIARSTTLKVQTDPHKCQLGQWLVSEQGKALYDKADASFKQIWDSIPETHNTMHISATRIQAALAAGNVEEATAIFKSETEPMLEGTLQKLRDLRAASEHEIEYMKKANEIYATKTVPALTEVRTLLDQIRADTKKHIMTDELMLRAARATRSQVTALAIATLLAGIVIALFTARNLIRLFSGLVDNLSQTSNEVNGASSQIAAASHSLAEGASEQAATLEETSSALEEMSSLTRGNADNTKEADMLMQQTRDAITTADASMQKLTLSMSEISSASAETQKIVKTIDEIAFQTNLLALNAAVEAARAGEAGAGFAVVADEVRSLAMRAAESAKDTSRLIDSTVDKVNNGETLLSETSNAFSHAARSTEKVSNLISEIASASKEQAQGIEQVNKAVNEIDKVTQSNAGASEQSASAAEQMSAQAAAMNAIVADLERMVRGGADQPRRRPSRSAATRSGGQTARRSSSRTMRQLPPVKPASGTDRKPPAQKRPEELLPLDDDDFQDF